MSNPLSGLNINSALALLGLEIGISKKLIVAFMSRTTQKNKKHGVIWNEQAKEV